MFSRAFILLVFLAAAACGQDPAPGRRPAVVATTAMIRSMVELLAGNYLNVSLLIPPGSCPSRGLNLSGRRWIPTGKFSWWGSGPKEGRMFHGL